MRWDMAGEAGIRLTLAETPSAGVTNSMLNILSQLEAQLGSSLIDAVPGYTTLTLYFDPGLISRADLISAVECVQSAEQSCASAAEGLPLDTANRNSRLITLPVWYSPESGADLESLAAEKALTIEQLIALHSGFDYLAYANGFAPGFCYLGEVSPDLAAPRLATPRRSVPAGSVAIADRQTAVYPKESPGGWRLLGRCPLPLFDIKATPPNRICVGDTVRFEPISRERFFELWETSQ